MKFNINSEAFKLSGMMYKSGYYTASEWLDKCGVNPLDYPQFFQATRHGAMYTTNLFNKCYQARKNAISDNWNAIGIAN